MEQMKGFIIGLAALGVLVLLVLGAMRTREQDRIHEQNARAECARLGGEAILDYSFNSNSFYITGCKIHGH